MLIVVLQKNSQQTAISSEYTTIRTQLSVHFRQNQQRMTKFLFHHKFGQKINGNETA